MEEARRSRNSSNLNVGSYVPAPIRSVTAAVTLFVK